MMTDQISQASLIHPNSLGETLDAVNAVLFDQQALAPELSLQTALWIADRQGLPGAYAGMFAPTEHDYSFGSYTFTGEAIRSGAATGHILSEESCAALYRLSQQNAQVRGSVEVQQALQRARRGILHRLGESEVKGTWSGVYCCGMCTVSLWRHFLTSGIAEDQHRIEHGLAELRRHRDGQGRWRRFPFHYTLLALLDIDLPEVQDEFLYAGAVIERGLRRLVKNQVDEHDQRKMALMQRVLEKC